MDDYAVVLNAGSSSLKFCVYRRPEADGVAARSARPDRRASARRRGSLPRTAPAQTLADQALDKSTVRDGRDALDALADWLRAQYGGARVLGVGHRVVHGGARFAGPTIVTPQVLERAARRSIPLAPLHQPLQPRGDRRGLRAASRTCRRSPASTPAFIAVSRPSPSSCRCRGDPRRRRAALRLPRAVVRVHRVGAARGRRRRSPTGA